MLRARLGGKMHSRTHSTFFANCQADASLAKRRHWEHTQFMNHPLQVYSFKAVDTFFIGTDMCKKRIELHESMPEARYMTHCLKLLGTNINPHMSLHLLSDAQCNNTWTTPDCTSEAVAFHSFRSAGAYASCWTKARSSRVGEEAEEVEVQVKK